MMTIDPVAFFNVSVNHLDLSYNRLQSVGPYVFAPLNRTLARLKIGGNPLQVSQLWSSVLSPRVGLNLTELDVADLAIGRDQHFQSDLFALQVGLKSLNLSGSEFSYVPAEMLQSLHSLKELDLSRNQLSSLTDLTLAALTSLPHLRKIHLHGNPWYCDACVIGPLLKWLDVSPASQHIKDGCRGLKTNAANATSSSADDVCPVCREPAAVAGVELARLDHVNLPTCNYPPQLIDSHRGLSSKVRGVDSAASNLSSGSNTMTAILENPLYVALICGVGVLLLAVLCALIAVASRRAASYYTNEEKRNKTRTESTTNNTEREGLFPLCSTVGNDSDSKKNAALLGADCLNKNNNRKCMGKKQCKTQPIAITSRGVHCPNNTSLPCQTSIVEHEDHTLC